MTIAEVSEKYALTADTLRYYERIGLIPPVPRTQSGFRNYDEESCRWIELMKCMRSAGVQIEALTEYVRLFRQGEETAPARKALRLQLAREEDVPAYIVFSNAVLSEIARRRPRDMSQFLEIPGVGYVKAARYGSQFLDVVAAYS